MTFDDLNSLLHSYADAGILEPMVEPIDENDCDPIASWHTFSKRVIR